MYEIYIARSAEVYGLPKTREIYEQAVESGLPDKDVKTMCLKYAELEKSLGEIDRARGIHVFASQFADPRSDLDFWNKWHDFEVQHGNEDTFREMLRIKRSVSASYSQILQLSGHFVLLQCSIWVMIGRNTRGGSCHAKTHFILPEYLMQKDQRLNIDDAKDRLKQAGLQEDEMSALERQLSLAANKTVARDSSRSVGFVSAGVQSQSGEGIQVTTNQEDIELPAKSDSEEGEKVEIAQKDVPSAVFGGLNGKREEPDKDDAAAQDSGGGSGNRLGALERIKRQRQR